MLYHRGGGGQRGRIVYITGGIESVYLAREQLIVSYREGIHVISQEGKGEHCLYHRRDRECLYHGGEGEHCFHREGVTKGGSMLIYEGKGVGQFIPLRIL